MHWQRFQMKGKGGGGGLSWAKTDAKQELNRLPISRGFSAEDLNRVQLPGSVDALADIGVESRSGIVCDLELSSNIDKKTLWVCVEVGLNGTKKLITAVPQHVLNCFAQFFKLLP